MKIMCGGNPKCMEPIIAAVKQKVEGYLKINPETKPPQGSAGPDIITMKPPEEFVKIAEEIFLKPFVFEEGKMAPPVDPNKP